MLENLTIGIWSTQNFPPNISYIWSARFKFTNFDKVYSRIYFWKYPKTKLSKNIEKLKMVHLPLIWRRHYICEKSFYYNSDVNMRFYLFLFRLIFDVKIELLAPRNCNPLNSIACLLKLKLCFILLWKCIFSDYLRVFEENSIKYLYHPKNARIL